MLGLVAPSGRLIRAAQVHLDGYQNEDRMLVVDHATVNKCIQINFEM